MHTDALAVSGPLSGMACYGPETIERATEEFGRGVWMASETGNGSQDVAELVTQLAREMKALADAQAAPRLHPLVAIFGCTLLTFIAGALIAWGSMTARIQTLERATQSIDEMNSMRAQIVMLTGTITRLESRFNDFMDSQQRAPRK